MGSPGKTIDRIKQTAQDAVADVSLGAQQLKEGQVERGLTNIATGGANLAGTPVGASAAGVVLQGETALTRESKDAAGLAIKDAKDLADTKEAARKTKIQDRLNAEIGLRQKSPGKAQTLLTSTLTPSATANNSLLTSTLTGMGRR